MNDNPHEAEVAEEPCVRCGLGESWHINGIALEGPHYDEYLHLNHDFIRAEADLPAVESGHWCTGCRSWHVTTAQPPAVSQSVEEARGEDEPRCWLCHGYRLVDKRPTGETSWSAATGGEHGKRFTVYSLNFAPSVFSGELIDCPVCKPLPPSSVL